MCRHIIGAVTADVREIHADLTIDAMGRQSKIGSWLTTAGGRPPEWADVEVSVDNRTLDLPPDGRAAAKSIMAAGPGQRVLGQSDAVRAEVEEALVADFEHRRDASGIRLPAGFLVVSARHP